MKKRIIQVLLFLLFFAVAAWRIDKVFDVRVGPEPKFESCPSASYYGRITGLSDYGNIVIHNSKSDILVLVDDNGNYSVELKRRQYPLIEFFSFESYNKSFSFVTKKCLKVRMDFDFYDTLVDGAIVKDCRVAYTGDYKDVFDYLNYNDFNKEVFEPAFEKFSNVKEPVFKDYYDEIKSGERLYLKKIRSCKDKSIHSVLVSMLNKDVNMALMSFAMFGEETDPDYRAWVETLDPSEKEMLLQTLHLSY